MKINRFIMASVIATVSIACLQATDIKEESYLYYNAGINVQKCPIPSVGISYMKLLGNVGVEVSAGVNTLVLASIPFATVDVKYHFTPELMQTWFVGGGIQAMYWNKVYIGPRLVVGKTTECGKWRFSLSCGAHEYKDMYTPKYLHFTPKLEISKRLNIPK